jgi:hypothetical protein
LKEKYHAGPYSVASVEESGANAHRCLKMAKSGAFYPPPEGLFFTSITNPLAMGL